MNKNYEKDLNDLKEQILKEGDTLLTKRELLERFCEIDKEYNGRPWNLLQILTNINILIGEEPYEDAVSRQAVAKFLRNHTNDFEDVKVRMAIKALEQDNILDKIRAEIDELDVLKYSSGERIYKDEVLDIIDKYKVESGDK